jgi:hypothetical protein
MLRHRGARQTNDYNQQAFACARAALATSVTEIKEAYLNLEQGWLCLAAKGDANLSSAVDFSAPPSKPELKSTPASEEKVAVSNENAAAYQPQINTFDDVER